MNDKELEEFKDLEINYSIAMEFIIENGMMSAYKRFRTRTMKERGK